MQCGVQSLMMSSVINKEQCASINLAHFNENGIGSWADPFFQWA